jgi:antirestriction protein
MRTLIDTPKIYVACLASYNAGKLFGKWIDASQSAEAIQEEIREMLKGSPEPFAEEWAIHDYEGFEGIRLDEYESIGKVAELAKLIQEHGEAFAAYAGYVGLDYATAEGFEEAYSGEWGSEEEFAEDLMRECHEIPEHLEFYIDYEKFARDLFINDYFSAEASGGGVYVFRHI